MNLGKVSKEKLSLYRKAAQEGDTDAQYNLGICYQKGSGVKKDDKEAIKWFRKAAIKKNPGGQVNLGMHYAKGKGIEKDDKKAIKLFREAAAQNDASGQFNLGVSYLDGSGVKKDTKEAVKWFRKAAAQNDIESQYNLGVCYRDGKGVKKDDKEAIKWFLKTATQGDASAQNELGECYYYGKGELTIDKRIATSWYQKAAIQGNKNAQYSLGYCYMDGEGIPENKKNSEIGLEWLKKAAAQGDTNALDYLKELPTENYTIERNEKKEIKFHSNSTETQPQKKENKIVTSKKLPLLKKKTSSSHKNTEKIQKKRKAIEPTALSSSTTAKAGLEAEKSEDSYHSKKPRTKQKEEKKLLSNSASPPKKMLSSPSVKEKKPSNHKPLTPTQHASPPSSKPRFNTTQVGETRQITVIDKKFVPIIEPGKLNYASVRFFKPEIKQKPKSEILPNKKPFNPKDIVSRPAEKQKKLTEEAKNQIGRWGEDCVYHKLKQHYEKKYRGKAKETENGFSLEGMDVSENKVMIEVTWYNKKCESGGDKDLKITKHKNGTIKERYIEVKTTTSNEVHKAIFPASEWLAMLQYKEKYSIYRVFNAGQIEDVRIEKIKNPLEKIINGQLEIQSMQLKI